MTRPRQTQVSAVPDMHLMHVLRHHGMALPGRGTRLSHSTGSRSVWRRPRRTTVGQNTSVGTRNISELQLRSCG